ncbi:MAG: hypothetical protein RLZZ519_979 [Bacteroidota bacterium]|jgi:hypothetical protein
MRKLLFAVFALATLWLTFNLHSKTGYFTYKSEIFSDKAGYYSYLPAAFVFDFDARQISDTLPAAVGNGFLIQEGKIFTKYPVGVAVMQAPFFLVTHFVIAPALGYPANGFSPPYYKMIDVAAWFYMLLATWILSKVLSAYFKPVIVWSTLGCFFLGTNLWYYYAVESGMSHIYSFFLVSALIRLTQLVHRQEKVGTGLALGLGAVIGMLVLTRFTNVLLLPILLFWDVNSVAGLKQRILLFLNLKAMALLLAIPLLLAAVQMRYYYYLTGTPFLYAYDQEGFDFLHPEVIKAWFSPHNGLFLFAPMMVFALVGLGQMAKNKIAGAWLGLVLFAVTSFVFASWWQWYFGCAYGARSFVEYFPVYMLGFAYFLNWIGTKALPWRIGIGSLLALMVVITFKDGYLYKLCYFGEGDWDWNWFLELVGSV